jgi:syntaxin 6
MSGQDEYDDPFYVVKEEVQHAADTAEAIFKRWQELLKNTNTAESDEFDWTTSELITNIKSIEQDLAALDETVSIVENHKGRFNLDNKDIEQRKAFIDDTRLRITHIHAAIDHPKTREKMEHDRRQALALGSAAMDAGGLRGNLIIEDERQEQQKLMADQDELMVEIGQGVDRLADVSKEMNAELRAQNRMLEETNKNTADLLDRVKVSSKKLTDLLENSTSTTQKCAIIIVLTIMFVGMVYFTFLW